MFRNDYQASDRLFNAFDYGHAILYERLWTTPDAPAAPLAIATPALHLLAAGGWLGTLLMLVVVGLPATRPLGDARGPAVAAMVRAFSPWALALAGVAAVTGALSAWLHLGPWTALWTTTYGRTLLVTLAVLAPRAATGAYNWRRVRPALGELGGSARLTRAATLEPTLAALALAVTAVLVATPPDAVP